jgi:hypothetical protein
VKALAFAVLGGVLLVIGVLGLVIPVSVDDRVTTLTCGNALSGTSAPGAASADLGDACADKIALRRVWGWPAGVVGLIVVAGAVVTRVRST